LPPAKPTERNEACVTLWLDAHLDPKLAPWLGSTFNVTAVTLKDVGLRDAEDEQLFAAARRFGKIAIVTKDEDFPLLVRRLGAPPQIVWLRFGNMRTVKMRSLLSMTFAEVLRHLGDGCSLVEVSEAGHCVAS
jgi:predicted nuclease of predicted toxin-antitoxin system